MPAEIQTIGVQCEDCLRELSGSVENIKRMGWLFVNNTPYVEESRVYCVLHKDKHAQLPQR